MRRRHRGRGRHRVAAEVIHRRVDAAALHRHAGRGKAEFDAGERAEQLRLVDVGEMADTEDFASHLAETRSERDVETLEDGFTNLVGVEAVGNANRREARRVGLGIGALDVETPAAHGAPGRFGETIMPVSLAVTIGCQSKYALGSFAVLLAASAFFEMALKLSPGGNSRPFCEPPTATSTPHSSCRKS